MQFAILCYETEADFAKRGKPDYTAGWMAYGAAMRQAGVLLSGAGLMPPGTATSVRIDAGKTVVHDGPYADAKEQLGGFYIIEAANIDGALHWASKAPTTTSGSTEVRPLLPPMSA